MADDAPKLLPLLNEIATEQNYQNYDLKVSPISTHGAKYSSKLYLIRITSDGKEDLRLFAKVAAISETMRQQCAVEPYDNERFVYTELVPTFRRLEDKWSVLEANKLAVPRYYGADSSRFQETLVLEDLACQGFTLHGRQDSVSWQYAAAAVTELAKFHALSFSYQHEDPTGFSNVADQFIQGMFTDNEGNQVFWNNSVNAALKAVREENREKLKMFLDNTDLANFCSMYRALQYPVLIHADFRPSNMLHRLRDDGTIEVIVVDYQTVQKGCPVIDLLYFIFTATDGQFRSKHYQELVDHYYSELGVALARLGLDVQDKYPRKDFEFELQEKLSYGLKLSVLVLPILMMADELAPQMDQALDMAYLSDVRTGSLYVTRLNEVVDDYIKWGVLV